MCVAHESWIHGLRALPFFGLVCPVPRSGATTFLELDDVFTLNPSFYPTTSAVPPASFLLLHPTEMPWCKFCGHSETEKNQTLKSKSSASVPGTRPQQKNKLHRQMRATKENTKRIKNKRILRWGGVQNDTRRNDTYYKILRNTYLRRVADGCCTDQGTRRR